MEKFIRNVLFKKRKIVTQIVCLGKAMARFGIETDNVQSKVSPSLLINSMVGLESLTLRSLGRQ